METLPAHPAPDRWMRHLFSAKVACDGGVVRRQLRDIERIVGVDAFTREIRRRGYRAVVNGDHVVIFCNRAPLHLID